MEVKPICHCLLLSVLYLGHVSYIMAEGPVILEFANEERRVHELYVRWNISTEYEVDQFEVTCQKIGRQSVTHSGKIENTEELYAVMDLHPESDYTICFRVMLAGDDSDECQKSEDACYVCSEMSTIKLIRIDSLIAVILTLAAIVGLCIIGYCCWYCAKKKQQEKSSEDEEEPSDEGRKPILLSVPDN